MSDYHAFSPAEIREAAQQLNEDARENFSDPKWRADRAADITQSIYENFEYMTILDRFGQVQNLALEDRSYVSETTGLKATWIARGGYIEQSDVRKDVVEIPRDSVGFHVSEFEDKLISGFAETASNLVNLGSQRLGAAVNSRALALFETTHADGTADITTDGSTLTLAKVNTAIAAVREESMGQITMMGRAPAINLFIDEILGTAPASGYLPETNEEIIRTGKIGTYRGVPVVEIPNYKDGEDRSYWTADDIWIVGDDAAQFRFFGGVRSKEFMEQDNWYWHYIAKQDFGGLVNHPERAHKIYGVA